MPPRKLALTFQRLLPILYKLCRISISGYSKAPRGLSVLSRVTCIFTGTMISPSLSLRQCPNRYAFRAGRNLPDKEFRYLRMVIVTTAVYWGLSSPLRIHSQFPLTFQHRAGVSPYTSSYDFARTCVFGKQSFPPGLCAPHRHHTARVHDSSGPPYPKVTGAFCRVPSPRFTRSPRYTLPIHQCRFRVRADPPPRSRSFSRQYRITHSPTTVGSPSCLNLHAQRIYLPDSPHT